ncbi:MAG TPA: hypothetical protein VFT06_10390 [Flavisolibacter sp.]|nr:hypothetical protein [Flavisolibacter sp.]
MSRVFDNYYFSGNYERDEALRIRKMEEEWEWWEHEQAQKAIAEAQQPLQRFLLEDGTVLEETQTDSACFS